MLSESCKQLVFNRRPVRQRELLLVEREYTQMLETVYRILLSEYTSGLEENLKIMRGYVSSDKRVKVVKDMGGFYLPEGVDLSDHLDEEQGVLSGLITKKGKCYYGGRIMLPIRDIDGSIRALVGYKPDPVKKYLTTPTLFFSKKIHYFNSEWAYRVSQYYGGLVFVPEGIFDTVALRAAELPVMGTMGADISRVKGEILKLFKRVVVVPDDDATGRRAVQSRYSKSGRNKWNIPQSAVMIKLEGSEVELGKIKDFDDVLNYYECCDVKEYLLNVAMTNKKFEKVVF